MQDVFHQNVDVSSVFALKQGMTNDSFRCEVDGKTYVIRLNGIGTEQLLDRAGEAEAYRCIAPFGMGEHVVAISPEKGYKVTEFLPDVRPCRPQVEADVRICMKALHRLHALRLPFTKTFDIMEQIVFYERLCHGVMRHADYEDVKRNVFRLAPLQALRQDSFCLCHIDAVADNFLLAEDGRVHLIDWEYAAGCDPLMDPAMFAIYAGYSRAQSEKLLDLYLSRRAQPGERLRFFSFMAAGGLLWSNWCDYKEQLGETFGSYAESQYRFAIACPQWAMDASLEQAATGLCDEVSYD